MGPPAGRRGPAEKEAEVSQAGTIDALFDRLEREAAAHRMTVRYHPDLGYPIAVFIDPIPDARDEELSIHMSA